MNPAEVSLSQVDDITVHHLYVAASRGKRKLSDSVSELEEIRDTGRKVKDDASVATMFRGMGVSLADTYKSFCSTWEELADLDAEHGTNVITEEIAALRERARKAYYESLGYVQDYSDRLAATTPRAVASLDTSMFASSARRSLPSIPIPIFDGQRSHWKPFYDSFNSLIHQDVSLNDIDKFHYLLGALTGPAAALIKKLPATSGNYAIAWNTLIDNYDDQRLLASAYLDQLLEIQPLSQRPPNETMRILIADITDAVAAFKALEVPDHMDFTLFHIVRKCLDPQTVEAFEAANSDDTFPTFTQLISFLRRRCNIYEKVSGVKFANLTPREQIASRRQPMKMPDRRKCVSSLATSAVPENSTKTIKTSLTPPKRAEASNERPTPAPCFMCQEQHPLYHCKAFTELPVEQRHTALKDWSGCRNCLSCTHNTRKCQSRWRCRHCQGRHHSLLHRQTETPTTVTAACMGNQKTTDTRTTELTCILGTAIVQINHPKGGRISFRAVLDTASHASFITRKAASTSGLTVIQSDIRIQGIGGTPMPGFRGLARCQLSDSICPEKTYDLQVIVVDHIMSPQPMVKIQPNICSAYMKYQLADPEFWVTKSIDMLLGCDVLADILTGEIVDVPKSAARLIGTTMGFVVLGRVPDMLDQAQTVTSLTTTLLLDHSEDQLQKDLHRFWAIEDPPAATVMSSDERRCEEHFQKSVSRLSTGRYMVKLPFQSQPPQSKVVTGACLRRLYNLEAKLSRSPRKRILYNEFMKEYIDLRHMEKATTSSPYVIPHQGVFKGSPPNDKVRVVFDASAKPGCLNQHLLAGPKLQNDLANILLNFRRHKYVFTADISKMYRQILVDPSDRQYQHILWRFDPADPVQEFELQTLTYGMACAPYLALRVIKQLVADEGDAFPQAADAVLTDMYIDDFVSGANTLEEAIELKSQVTQLMLKAELPLSKWTSNNPALLNDSERQHMPLGASMCLDLEEAGFIKILGLRWNPSTDIFCYQIDVGEVTLTKRGLLANIAKIYDPLGFLSPVIVSAKIILQDTWKCELDWDTPLPELLARRVQDFFTNLSELRNLRIPRHVCSGKSTHVLIFADASERAYCACAYLRVETECNGTSSLLLQAKTKVSPIKTLTIPRLELSACLLASTLLRSLRDFMNKLPSPPITLMFSDSQVALSWIKRPHLNLPTFVANRVARIIEETDASMWFHVKTDENPSDLGSRGATPRQLMDDPKWMTGPKWILDHPDTWDLTHNDISPSLQETEPSICANPVALPTQHLQEDWISRSSSFAKLIRVTAWALRFVHNTRVSDNLRKKSTLSVDELRRAIEACCRTTQAQHYPTCTTAKIPRRLVPLTPFTDERGLLRVGGRLKHAPLPPTARHPILLPHQSHLAQLIVAHYHKISLHPGPSLLAALVRTKYWITGLRNLTRKICRECVLCRRADAKTCQPIMGDLPCHRFQEGRAFLNVGFDFGGPFIIRDSLKRKAGTSKAYLCLAVCLSTRAVHLEAVSSLSTAAYIAALERFISRRGLPSAIFSDNGTNFVGAKNLLSEWYRWQNQSDVQEALLRYTTDKQIEWHFLPPQAPHFGGLWEAGIKAAKRLLRSTYGEASLTFEEFHTLLAKVEGMLNSRPLCSLSEDAHDDFLTPGHFLIGSSLHAPPEPCVLDQKPNYTQRWQVVTRISQHFWKRWRQEYLGILQIKAKWTRPDMNLEVGDLVFVKDERVPRLQWPRGRVTAIHPGSDGRVRVVTIRTATSTFQRPVVKLVPLFCPTIN